MAILTIQTLLKSNKIMSSFFSFLFYPLLIDLYSHALGTLLINERMLESYVIARDRFLAPDGKMFPTTGRYICHLELHAKF